MSRTPPARPAPTSRASFAGAGLAALLVAGLVLLLAHARVYAFLTDDAFISFRYARNFAHGHGLVFNPGLERVEGYSNLLWVLVLAALERLGVHPEHAANPLSVLCTLGLWAVLAAYAWKRRREPAAWCLGAAVVWLAATRSVAVWTTSGLETRCFELWVVWGVLRLAEELEAAEAGLTRTPLAALLFALSALTRPDGLLIAASACAVGGLVLAVRRRAALPRYVGGWLGFALIVGAQLAFRRAYYGEWVPNTYFAKVGGHTDVRLGLEYLWAFALEYAAFLWLPLIVLGALRLARARAMALPALVAAVLVPYVVYVVTIGGDHFEFRPLDLVFPLVFPIMAEGLRAIAAMRAGALTPLRVVPAATAGLVVAAGLFVRPWQTHVQTPAGYHPGFPGHPGYEQGIAHDFLAPARDGIYRAPGLAAIAAEHRRLLFALTFRFACIRQEEHVGFLATAMAEGERIRRLVADGRLPRDVHIAMSCVGAMPYLSGVIALDRHGLTDAHVARGPFSKDPLLAHGKFATIEYARARGVDLWTVDKAYLTGAVTDDNVLQSIRFGIRNKEDDYAADLGDGRMLMVQLPQGIDAARRRMPRLQFMRLDDPEFIRHFVDVSLPYYYDWMRAHPADLAAGVRLAYIARMGERWDIARSLYEQLEPLVPPSADFYEQLADCYEGTGDAALAAKTLDRAVAAARPNDPARADALSARANALRAGAN